MKKFKGSGLLIMTIVSAAIIGLISFSLVKMHSTSLYSLTSKYIITPIKFSVYTYDTSTAAGVIIFNLTTGYVTRQFGDREMIDVAMYTCIAVK